MENFITRHLAIIFNINIEYQNVVNHELLKNVPLLVLVSKQDKEGATSTTEITVKLRIRHICDIGNNKREWFVQGCSAHTGNGLTEGLDWIAKILKDKKS